MRAGQQMPGGVQQQPMGGQPQAGGPFSAMFGPMITAVGQQRGFDAAPMLSTFDRIAASRPPQNPVLAAFQQRRVPGGHR